MMTLEHPLDDDSRAFLAAVEEFGRTEVAPYADQWDHDEQLPREIFSKAGKIGLMGMVAPNEYGGQGMSYVTAALAVGIAEAAFDRANSYANERKQFGHAIGDFQAIQWMLVDSAMELEAAEVMTMHAAYLQDQKQNTTKESAMAKLFASESAVKICDRAMQIHGGYGYSRDLPIERYLRDAKLCEIGEGTSQVQRLVIARHVLKEAKPLKLAHREPRAPNR